MTAAYAAFENHGLVPQPILIRRVEDLDGTVLYESHDSSTRAISDTTAFMMSSMLADVINAGTGNRARSLGFTLPAAGKTGTTNDFNDAWFVGYTHEAGHRRVGRLRSAAHDSAGRLRRRRRGADVGEVHEGRDPRRQARVAPGAGWHHHGQRLPPVGQASQPTAARTRRSSAPPDNSSTGRWSTPSTSPAEPSRRRFAICIRPTA